MVVKIYSEPATEVGEKKRFIVNSQSIDLRGKRFGRWRVMERAENTPDGSAKWLCECDCGTRRVVNGQSLREGRSTSCRCYKIEFLKGRRSKDHPSYKTGSRRNKGGYVLVLDRDHPNAGKRGYLFEHIVVMSTYLKRALLPGETVHHKNGVKDDNRIENLELWSGNHAPGARVTDMIEFCVDYLKKYAPKRLAEDHYDS
jgi:hypothetical protein